MTGHPDDSMPTCRACGTSGTDANPLIRLREDGPLSHRFACGYKNPDYVQPTTEDSQLDCEWVYCASHRRPHTVGWCSVSVGMKTPLKATDRDDALRECAERDLRVLP